jgi:hypothetical protein
VLLLRVFGFMYRYNNQVKLSELGKWLELMARYRYLEPHIH